MAETDITKPLWLTPAVETCFGHATDREVAKLARVSRSTVNRWRNRLRVEALWSEARKQRERVVPHVERQVRMWQKRFRVLKGWNIRVRHDARADCQTQTIDVKAKRAVILTCEGLPTDVCDEFGVPRDYVPHELLHVALAAAQALGPKAGEEVLVQDLASMLVRGVHQWDADVRQLQPDVPEESPRVSCCGAMSVKDDRDHCDRPRGHEGMCYTRGRWWGKGCYFDPKTGEHLWIDDECPPPGDLLQTEME